MAKKTKRSYAELDSILGGRNYRDNNYCAIIALSIATHVNVGKIKRYVENYKGLASRKHGKGTPFALIDRATLRFGKMTDTSFVVTSALRGRTLHTVHTKLARAYPNDTFFIYTSGHMACIREGILEDHTARRPSRRIVRNIYRVIDRS